MQMPKKTDYIDIVDTFIQGIPCKVGITYFFEQKPFQGSVYNCPSDMDWYGYQEWEYDVLDSKGYPAPWLERKMDDHDNQRIDEDIAYARQKAIETAVNDYDGEWG